MANDLKKWKQEMKDWLKKIIEWQEANPDKYWFDELNKVQTEDIDGGGSNPKPPPPPPPGTGNP
jgi:hypothetical protein